MRNELEVDADMVEEKRGGGGGGGGGQLQSSRSQEERRRRRKSALIKSNNPHLAGMEKRNCNFLFVARVGLCC